MKWFLSIIDTVNARVGELLSYLVLIMFGITLFEVVGRFAFNNPTIWAHETTTQLYGFYLVMLGGYALLHRAHIRVDVFWSRLPPRKKAIIDLLTCGFAFILLGTLLWFAIEMAWNSWLIREHSPTPFGPPVYPLKASLVVGTVLFLLQLIAKVIRDARYVITGVEDA